MGLFDIFFSGKKSPEHTLSDLKVDVHSHLIPGIDDGAKSMEESIDLIQALSNLGYQKLITTPHIMYDAYRNNSEIILSGLELLRKEISVRNIDIRIEAAAEYYLDEHFLKLLDADELMTFGSNYVLFETSYVTRPYGLHEQIYAILSHGYKPVLAHPERYLYLHESYDEYRKIKDMGVLFQVNINSLIGYYTNPVKKAAEWIVENGLVDFVGSDTHKMRHVAFLEKAQVHPNFQKIFKMNTLLNGSLF